CGIPLDETGVGGIRRHLTEYHADVSQCNGNSDLIRCGWNNGTGECGQAVDAVHYARHISTVHLHLGACICEYCGVVFSRLESLKRH
ncbi:uncharacterized protein B0H18DRAFT_850897, partial [Fomitopsis serialis]|uniref:uncharacterized protein n=1 Tax=Fomitopsis serialis TaxID=139415 RepID=UPI002008B3D5